MPITYVTGDIFLTEAQSIAVGLSANGRLDVSPLSTTLNDHYPVFVSELNKRGRSGIFSPGDIWLWRESQPRIVAMFLRATPLGTARLRHVEKTLLNLANSWEREGIASLALMRLIDEPEWRTGRELIAQYLGRTRLPITVYESYEPGVTVTPVSDTN